MPDITQWPSGIRDTTEFPSVTVEISADLRGHLQAFLNMDGVGWNAYEAQGAAGGLALADSRLRTYRKMYERLGLVFKQGDNIRLSRLGLGVRDLESRLITERDALLGELRTTAVEILARYQLRNPIDGPDLPQSCDIHPYWCIWAAMHALDDKINYEEMNRVILHIPKTSDLPAAIEKIRNARTAHGNYNGVEAETLNAVLGEPTLTDQPTARIASWFSFAGWGGLIIEQQTDADGYRHLTPASIPAVVSQLENPPILYETDDRDDWLTYYIGSASDVDEADHNGDNGNIRIIPDESTRLTTGRNVLLYGVPGSGKSWTIEHEYCTKDSIVERLVFHPDYTNADFVGQILPVVDEEKQVTYEFTPGPFTTILYNAYCNPMQKFILIIEEINRGNAPAIFGEVFQLLDRKVDMLEGDDGFPVGTSEFGITHKYMAEFVYGNLTQKVRIPSNLSIIGTMNTSDQNVFTLDTAFQRRWKMRLIENNFENVRISLANAQILDTDVTWKRFCETVNTIIVGNKAKMASAEDKRLGVYFVHESDLKFDQRALPSEGSVTLMAEYNALLGAERSDSITAEQRSRLMEIREAVMNNRLFPEKVIKYLWDDAFKFNPEALFDEDMDNLERVIRTFIYSKGQERFKIFKQSVRDTLYTAQQ